MGAPLPNPAGSLGAPPFLTDSHLAAPSSLSSCPIRTYTPDPVRSWIMGGGGHLHLLSSLGGLKLDKGMSNPVSLWACGTDWPGLIQTS